MSAQSLTRIVLTGGPCGGKTTALARIVDHFTKQGYRVVVVPEMATLVINAGFKPGEFAGAETVLFQSSILDLILAFEDECEKLAQKFGRVLMICDRGALDGKAYCSESTWKEILAQRQVAEAQLRDHRYHAVVHLVTAADGAREFYTKANNSARQEDAELAVELDQKLQAAWTGHPHFRIIDNATGFEGKMHRTVSAVANVLGIPAPLEIERKYVLAGMPQFPAGASIVTSRIAQTYLLNPAESERVRAREHDGFVVYTHARKIVVQAGQRIEIERIVTEKEYHELFLRRDPARRTIAKLRHCLVWNKRQYEIDEYLDDLQGFHVLEVEVDSLEEAVELPPFLAIQKEVTGNTAWDNSELARARPV